MFPGVPGVMLIGGGRNNHTTTVLPMTDEASCGRTFPLGYMFSGVYYLVAARYNYREILVCGGYRSEYRKSCHSLDLDNDRAEWEVAPDMPDKLASGI